MRRSAHEEERVQRRADCGSVEGRGGDSSSEGALPADRDQRRDVLQLESDVRGVGSEPGAAAEVDTKHNTQTDSPQRDCCPCFKRVSGEEGPQSRAFYRSYRPSLLRRRQAERNVLARVVNSTDGNDDVLLAIDRVGHGGTALRGWHPDRPHLFSGFLVVG